jgi:hypothetical protein
MYTFGNFYLPLSILVRVFAGFSGYDKGTPGMTQTLYLTIMVHAIESSTKRGAKSTPEAPLWHSAQRLWKQP